MGINLGNLAALRTCRVFRALKTVAIVPGKYKNPTLTKYKGPFNLNFTHLKKYTKFTNVLSKFL